MKAARDYVPEHLRSRRDDVQARLWNKALATALRPRASAAAKLESVLTIVDAHINGVIRCPAAWGDTQSAEMMLCELLFVRALLVGAEPFMHGGPAFNRAKRRCFGSDNGPASNWIGREDFDTLKPLLALAVRSERKRMGVPSKVFVRRAMRGGQ